MIKNNENKWSKKLYQNLLRINDKLIDINGDNLHQIRKDTIRTYPSTIKFNKKERILNKLENVLKAFSNYEHTIKYCQVMNFIVGFFYFIVKDILHFGLLFL